MRNTNKLFLTEQLNIYDIIKAQAPANSPDLNPVERLFKDLKYFIAQKNVCKFNLGKNCENFLQTRIN